MTESDNEITAESIKELEDKYQEWLQSRDITDREDMEAYQERDIMPDDDGDAEGDFDPYNF